MRRARRSASSTAAELYATPWGSAPLQTTTDAIGFGEKPPPRFSLAHLAAWTMAVIVILAEFCLLALGVFALIHLGIKVGSVLIAGFCGFLFWVTRPRIFVRASPDQRETVPGLASLVDPVAAAMSVRVARVRLWTGFNSFVRAEGVWQRPSVLLGVPMLAVLDGDERVALVAHELGHLVNHDPMNSVLMNAAMSIVGSWLDLFSPDMPLSGPGGIHQFTGQGLFEVLVYLVMGFFRGIVRFYGSMMLRPIRANQRRAELHADFLASQVAGTPATVDMLEKVEALGATYRFLIELAALHPDRRGRLAQDLAERTETFDGRRPPATASPATVWQSHPPTDVRIRALAGRNDPAKVRESAAGTRELDTSLAGYMDQVEQQAVSAYQLAHNE